MKDWKIKLDFTMTVALALTASVALCSCQTGRAAEAEPIETTYQPTTAATIAETTEPRQEPVETESPVTEATETTEVTEATEAEIIPAIPLYDVPLDEELQLHIIHTCEEHRIDPAIIIAMAYRESTYNPDCIGDGGESFGLLQVQPYWHSERMERLGCTDLLDPFQNVTVAVDYLAEMLGWYDGDIAKALVAYNQGSYKGTVTRYAEAVLEIAEELRGETYVLYR